MTKCFDFSTFLNFSEEILLVAFQKCFRLGPSSSRTRAIAVEVDDIGDDGDDDL